LDRALARADTRDWGRERRERTGQLIELGSLVQKAGLFELLDGDRATLLGALLDLADRLQSQENERQGSGQEKDQTVSRADLLARWRHAGLRPGRLYQSQSGTPARGVSDRFVDLFVPSRGPAQTSIKLYEASHSP
jgi:hypothetical protein